MSDAEANEPMEKCPKCGAPLPSGVLAGLCPACLFKQGAAAETSSQPEPAPFQPPTVEEVARLFPQLEILAFIGKGGMGAVYRARQRSLDRVVALKILPPQTAAGPGFIERFNREARALARLNHPNIVAVYEFGQVNGLPFFVMEFVDGLNLRELEQAGTLSARQALQVVPQICEALQFAHDEGIVHRDIKPENILVNKKGRVKIADFGIAKILNAEQDLSITEAHGAIGTPHYMAPEQMEKPTTVDHRADIFSLGVVFYEMLTGELPLGKFGPPSSRKVEVDVRLDEIVLRALERDPERRYQHVSQVKTAVDTIAGSAPPHAPPPPVTGEAMGRDILARDYRLNIGSCFRRALALLRGNFWPLVGVTALVLALMAAAGSIGAVWTNSPHETPTSGVSVLALLLYGPLLGGLFLYYLKTIRREPVNIETVFSGFSNRFLHLFLTGFVTCALSGLGFICFVLPGLYLFVAWGFAVPIVADKRMDFWPALELSRKVITKHWFHFFGLFLIAIVLCIAGLACCFVGIFITVPLAMITAMYAYEDIFGAGAPPLNQPTPRPAPAPAGFGPHGTMVSQSSPPPPSPMGGSAAKSFSPKHTLVIVLLIFSTVFAVGAIRHYKNNGAGASAQFDQPASPDEVNAAADVRHTPVKVLTDRLEAASQVADRDQRGRLSADLALDAANLCLPEIVKSSLQQIPDLTLRDQTAATAARRLHNRGLHQQAIEVGKSISDLDLRDDVLGELAPRGSNRENQPE
jgi:predicted Ser/Thr protein kinase